MQCLAEYLERTSLKTECHLFTEKDTLEEYLKNNELEVLLLGEEVDCKQIDYLEHVKNQLIFTEYPFEKAEATEGKIFKYQSAEKILEVIFEQCLKEDIWEKGKNQFKGETRFYGIYRLFESSSVMLEEVLIKKVGEEKTLILDMGLFDGISAKSQKGSGMSELLFYLKQQTEKIARKIPGLIQEWRGADYISAVEDYRDLYGITRKEMELFLQILSENTEYENIIFDLGFLGESTLYLLGQCDCVYLRKPQNQWEENQRDGFLRLLQREHMEKLVEKMEYVTIN